MSRERKPSPEPQPQRAPLPATREVHVEVEVAAAGEGGGQVRILTPRTGWVIGVEGGKLLVDYPGNLRGPLPARTTVPLDARGALSAAAARQGALLVFEDGDPAQPVLIGLVQPPVATLIDLVLEASDAGESAAIEGAQAADAGAATAASADGAVTASADGKRLSIEGEEEVTLRCGKASISLRRDGRVVVRGAYVETHASGTNRIKGGSVQIN